MCLCEIFYRLHYGEPNTILEIGQGLNPARPTSLKTVPARPKIWPGHEDVKMLATSDKGDRRRLLRNYVGVCRRPEHAPSNPATT